MKTIRIFLSLACLVFTGNLSGQESVQKLILGTWVSALDQKWELVFTPDGICKQYYEGIPEADETDSYILSNTSPQCGINMQVTDNTLFLSLKNLYGDHDEFCYGVTNIDDKYLSVSPFFGHGVFSFLRSFTDTVAMNPPFKVLSCTVANTGVDVSLKMRFTASFQMQAGRDYPLGNVGAHLRPEEVEKLTFAATGGTWQLVVTPDGTLLAKLTQGTPPPPEYPIDFGELRYQLFNPANLKPDPDSDGK